jgi:hypothetical protein
MLLLVVWIALFGFEALAASGPAGQVNYVIGTDSSWDQYTSNPSAAIEQWFLTNSWRIKTFSPYFDSRLKWDPNAWVYLDLYAIYKNGALATTHPEWVLKDPNGNKLFIPWGCSGGTCPQYAADISNPLYRNWWIAQAQQLRSTGYRGLWIDDVNLEFRVSDGTGNQVAPLDNQTGKPMLYDDWRRYMAEFTEQIRAAFPGWEIVHNAIWYADTPTRTADPYIQREIGAANYINLERGVVDSGITGGSGTWSLNALFAYVDAVHALGSNVVLDNYPGSQNYALASYFMVSNGGDAVSSMGMTPTNWWNGFSVNLGSALNARTTWQGVDRRDFTGGMALVNPPQSHSVTLTLPGTFYRIDGTPVTQVTLGAADGIVLLGSVSTGSFTLSPSPAAITLRAGNGGTSTITVGSVNGFTSSVNLAVSGCPANATCGVSPSPVTPSSGGSTTATLAVATAANTLPGTYALVVSGNAGNGGTQTTTVTLVVQALGDFSLSANPGLLNMPAGFQGSSTITIGSVNGFTSAVNLSVGGCPANTTCALSPSSVTPPSGGSTTSTLTVTTTANTPAGGYTLTISGNGGVHTVTVSLTVTASADFSLATNPGSLVFPRGYYGMTTVTLTSLNGFSGSVTPVLTGCPVAGACWLSPVLNVSSGGAANGTLIVLTNSAWPAGTWTLTITGTANNTAGPKVHTLQIPLSLQ